MVAALGGDSQMLGTSDLHTNNAPAALEFHTLTTLLAPAKSALFEYATGAGRGALTPLARLSGSAGS